MLINRVEGRTPDNIAGSDTLSGVPGDTHRRGVPRRYQLTGSDRHFKTVAPVVLTVAVASVARADCTNCSRQLNSTISEPLIAHGSDRGSGGGPGIIAVAPVVGAACFGCSSSSA